MKETKVTVVVTSYNQKDELIQCLKWLQWVCGIANVIVADNGSQDGTAEILAQSGYPYLFFDEGIQGYGTVWNAVINNFEMEDTIVFMEPQFFPGEKCVLRMADVLEREKCGLVGPVSNGMLLQYYPINKIENLQNMEEDILYHEPAEYRSLCPEKGIWAISKKVLQETGKFDEDLVHPKNVLLDYKLRLVQKGYIPIVCFQALAFSISQIEHYVDFENLLGKCDRDILKSKWNMNYFNLLPVNRILDFIKEEKETPIRVLEVGCDLGVNLLEIKNRYPNSQICGLEINSSSVEIAHYLAEVKVGNIEDKKIPFAGEFDYIIFCDVLEHLRDPEGVVRFCREYLTEHGCILASIPNLMNVSVMEQLLHGRFEYRDTGLLDRSHIHFFTYYEILRMFQQEGYIIEELKTTSNILSMEQEELVQRLMEISEGVEEHMFRCFQYIIKAKRQMGK
ncbi:MAG: methyltransferase domain-containing protein [Lachnospiraceae bacterium]|jgi:SAM-dependent methyltransferase/GT2 family glycosyltransferase|nr:methyltransferase domain-containing protein [Lachnospiraceae bacterium]